jgi:hypothetical protein
MRRSGEGQGKVQIKSRRANRKLLRQRGRPRHGFNNRESPSANRAAGTGPGWLEKTVGRQTLSGGFTSVAFKWSLLTTRPGSVRTPVQAAGVFLELPRPFPRRPREPETSFYVRFPPRYDARPPAGSASQELTAGDSLRTSPRPRRGGRVAERAGFENRYIRKGIGGSNPPLSA